MHPALAMLLPACTLSPLDSRPAAPPAAPNILLISVDTLRADHLPSYGYPLDTAPFLTEIAAQGAQFNHSWSQTPATDGSHSSLFTGRYVYEHRKLSYAERMPDELLTLGEHLQAQGYATAAFASSVKFTPSSGFNQGFDDYDPQPRIPKNERSAGVNAGALEAATAAGDRPWFIFAHYFDVHAPYAAPAPHGTTFLQDPPLAAQATLHLIRTNRRANDPVPAATLAQLRAQYDGGIRYFDAHLQALWQTVVAPATRPTLVVLTADHGDAFKEHGFIGHGTYLYEEIVRVPLIVWYPGVVTAGARLDEAAQTLDVFPTLVELAGLPRPDGLPGHSFAPALRGQPAPKPQRDIILQSPTFTALVAQRDDGIYKYTERHRGGAETRLERLDGPFAGTTDLSASLPALRDDLQGRLARLPIGARARAGQHRTDITAEEEEELRALGYLDEE